MRLLRVSVIRPSTRHWHIEIDDNSELEVLQWLGDMLEDLPYVEVARISVEPHYLCVVADKAWYPDAN